MQLGKILEQQIAVFGESGSGKTVLLSSFYGAAQEPGFLQSSLFNITADDSGQGNELHQNFLGMRDAARRPSLTRFDAKSYPFTVRLQGEALDPTSKNSFQALRLIWHDYPGEWFETDVDAELAARRIDTFRSLLGSDVAILLVDGQKLLDNSGEEERYLRSLFTNFRTGLLRLKDDLLVDGPLVGFPRIWILALSKADLLPDLDVFGFRDLVIGNAAGDLDLLRKEIEGLIESPEAFTFGEDFVLLSSARFEPDRIDVEERIGMDLVLPLASIVPLQRHLRWLKQKNIGASLAKQIMGGANALAAMLIAGASGSGIKQKFSSFLKRKQVAAGVVALAELAGEQAEKIYERSIAERDYMTAVLAGFEKTLSKAEQISGRPTLVRSKK